ncbi:DUF11 domain-containing protein [Sinosporangium siamense]|uniref:DUF11 domain-containing protein n=1 Tax=Sinosporangium siamense TaxID=1367973 RepID=A0A919RC09_9ACTN|nr:DUF11 domain-containing protein [Sinosporangium siamense]GII90892.1 hypothetical protein Ssi02_11230 [Sinosporangium siamense]
MTVVQTGTAEADPAGELGRADLSVSLIAAPAIAQPGHTLTYHVRVRNAGPGDAVLPVLRVRVPGDVAVVGVNVATCRPGATLNEVVCPSRSDIPTGDTGNVVITGMVRPGARGPLRATATLSSQVIDSREADNTAQASVPVDDGADLAVRLAPRALATPGGFTVGLVVHNRGPRSVKDALVFFRAALAGSTRARFVHSVGGRCRAEGTHLGCRLPSVRAGSPVRLRLAFAADGRQPRTVNGRASVHSTVFGDRRPDNNQVRARLAVSGHRGTRPRADDDPPALPYASV